MVEPQTILRTTATRFGFETWGDHVPGDPEVETIKRDVCDIVRVLERIDGDRPRVTVIFHALPDAGA